MAPFLFFELFVTIDLNKSLFKNTQLSIGFLCMLVAWLFPYSERGSPDALQQLFMLASLSVAALLFGMHRIPWRFSLAPVVWMLLVILTPNPYLSRQIAGVAGLFLFILACQVGVQVRRKPEGLVWLLFAIVVAAFANAVQGLLQWSDLVGELYRWVVVPEQRGIAYGAFRQRNLFATFVCVGAICTVWLVHLRRLTESMAWVLILVMMFAVVASGSRSGALEVIALAGLGVYWRKQHASSVTRLLVGQLGLLALAMVLVPMAADRLEFGFVSGASRVSQTGQDSRWLIWRNALEMIAARPWLGWGWHETAYGHYMTLFSRRHSGLLDNTHNLPLQLAVEFGLPATALFLGLLGRAIYVAKPWRQDRAHAMGTANSSSGISFAWAILLVIVGIHSMLEYPLWYIGFLFLTGLSVGYLLPVRPMAHQNSRALEFWFRHSGNVMAVCLLVLAITGWQQFAKVTLIYKTPFTNDRGVQRAALTAAVNNASDAWLFQENLDLTRLALMEVSLSNASEVRQLAEKLLHASAEPMVIQSLLRSLWYLNDKEALRFHAERFCHAFPDIYQRWYRAPAMQDMVLAASPLPQTCKP